MPTPSVKTDRGSLEPRPLSKVVQLLIGMGFAMTQGAMNINNQLNAEEMKSRLREMGIEIDRLKEKAVQAKARARIEYLKQLNEVEGRYQEMEKELKAFRESGEQGGQALGEGIRKAWNDLELAFEDARDSFKKTGA
jgi:hypothetical protein